MTTDPLVLFFLVVHILASGIWVSQFVVALALERIAQSLQGKAGEVAVRLAEGRAAQMMGFLGGMGILISGLFLTAGFHYGTLGIGGVYTPAWLAIKQMVYVVAMGIAGAMIIPNVRRAAEALAPAIGANQPAPAEAQAPLDRVRMASGLVNLLVLVDIFLGVFGVNGGYMG